MRGPLRALLPAAAAAVLSGLAAASACSHAPPPARRDAIAMRQETVALARPTAAAATPSSAPAPGGDADLCRRTAVHLQAADSVYPQEVEYRCALREGGPVRRLVLDVDRKGRPEGVSIYGDSGAVRPSQSLDLWYDGPPSISFVPPVQGADLNGDGWTDVRVQVFGGSGGGLYAVFLYDPAHARFVKDDVLTGAGAVSPRGGGCVGMGTRSGGLSFSDAEYCWRRGRWLLTRTDEQRDGAFRQGDSVQVAIRTRRELRAGTMRVVRVDTIRERVR